MRTKYRADDVIVALPLFHTGCGGAIPTSALQFHFEPIGRNTFMPLNEAWHSRLPECKNAFDGFFYGALYEGEYWAVAWWSRPVARAFNGKSILELRRFAIRSTAPKNTASRMLGWMIRDIQKTKPDIKRLISYQDMGVHKGTIYKASGWTRVNIMKGQSTWTGRKNRPNRQNQSSNPKARWEKDIL